MLRRLRALCLEHDLSMSETEILEHVRIFADQAHGDQVRKYTGERYIGHPVRVMETVRPFYPQMEVMAAALLHDVLEDTPVSTRDLEVSLSKFMDTAQVQMTVQLVVELTDVFVKKDYPGLNRRERKEKEAARLSAVSAAAQSIKYADIMDNVADIVRQDTDFARVFVHEAKRMLAVMESGHPELRARAVSLVAQCLQQLPKTHPAA